MAIFVCPRCKVNVTMPDSFAGEARCPKCHKPMDRQASARSTISSLFASLPPPRNASGGTPVVPFSQGFPPQPSQAQLPVRSPLIGGVVFESSDEGRVLTGTFGLAIDAQRLVTAGHAVGVAGSFVGHPDHTSFACRVAENNLSDGADLAVLRALPGVEVTPLKVQLGKGQVITVTFCKNELPPNGSIVYLVGTKSGVIRGKVRANDSDINTPHGQAKNVCVVDYEEPSSPGDSGGPIISEPNNGAKCYGVHGGAIGGQPGHYFTPFQNLDWDFNHS